MSSGGATRGLINKERQLEHPSWHLLKIAPVSFCSTSPLSQDSFLTQTQWWFPGKVSMNTSQFWLQPELPSPPPPGLLAWTKRIDYPKDFSSLFPIYLFISLTLNNPSWQLMRLICYPITRLSRDFLSHFRFSRVSPLCANLFGKLLKSCSGKQNEDNLCRIIQ